MVNINLTWGPWGKTAKIVSVDATGTAAQLKDAIYELSGVPQDRQKLMSSAWSGVLKNETSIANLKDGSNVTLMGTADRLAKPVEKVVFVEDLPASAKAAAGTMLPSGLTNLGNTCYANSTLEALRYVPELKQSLVEYKKQPAPSSSAASGGSSSSGSSSASSSSSVYRPLSLATADLMQRLDGSTSAMAPEMFLERLRAVCPHFAEQGQMGVYKQQDSEEFQGAIMNALAFELRRPTTAVPELADMRGTDNEAPPNVIDTLFGVEFEKDLKCLECPDEPTVHKREAGRKLVCNVDGGPGAKVQVNYMNEGIKLGLSGELEKRSEILGRNAVWTTESRIARLPKYLAVQFMRFYWKATPDSRDHQGVKCKMLRPVNFPADGFDVYEMCSEELKKKLKASRDKYVAAQGLSSGTASKSAAGSSSSSSSSSSSPAAPMEVDTEGDAELAAAIRLSMESGSASGSAAGSSSSSSSSSSNGSSGAIGYGLPADFRGLYELNAIVTHKGRSADSGHYMAWVRAAPGAKEWLVFDDSDVSEADTEYVLTHLKGGGDDHMAVMAFYRAKE